MFQKEAGVNPPLCVKNKDPTSSIYAVRRLR